MEQFKFDFFKKEHSSQTMNVVTLSKAECTGMKTKCTKSL